MKRAMGLCTLLLATVGCGKLHHLMAPVNPPPRDYHLPPAAMLQHPGPGVDGPGPGVLMHSPVPPPVEQSSQIAFVGPASMQVAWDVGQPGAFDSEPLIAPGRYNFPQGAIYRLKLTSIPGRPGVELYPSVEVGPATPRTDAYLAHNAIPVQFSEEDLDQVLSGNFVTKVIYLPDAEFQELAVAGVETLVSTRLDPGVDPIVEADRRGSIMAIVRLGNKDLGGAAPGAEMVRPVSYYTQPDGTQVPMGGMPMGGMPGGAAGMGMPGGVPFGVPTPPPSYISGVSMPEYGMPITGTPIGLPGPPHIPLGIPAGLKRHTITNHTHEQIPPPVHSFDIHVKQTPGLSYPQPVSKMQIHEQAVPTTINPAAPCPCP